VPLSSWGRKKVATMATVMPKAPIQVPLRACAGDDRKRKARMKLMMVTM